jgi:hypothetical protein
MGIELMFQQFSVRIMLAINQAIKEAPVFFHYLERYSMLFLLLREIDDPRHRRVSERTSIN